MENENSQLEDSGWHSEFNSKSFTDKPGNMVDTEEVKQVAENARIKISDEEAEGFTEDFQEILEMFETLDEVDTEDVEPSFHPVETESKTREDEEEETLEKEKVFQNTENEEDGYFKGPSV